MPCWRLTAPAAAVTSCLCRNTCRTDPCGRFCGKLRKQEPSSVLSKRSGSTRCRRRDIIRTACLAGAHGVIVPKHRASGLTATVVRASAGALNYIPVAKVTNLKQTMDQLKEKGIWFVCADMGGERMYDLNLTGPIGLVIGSEGEGVSRLVRENCDYTASIPMRGEIDSLNASVAAGVLMYEIVRQRTSAL